METETTAKKVRQLEHVQAMLEVARGEARDEYISVAKRLSQEIVRESRTHLTSRQYLLAFGFESVARAIWEFDNCP